MTTPPDGAAGDWFPDPTDPTPASSSTPEPNTAEPNTAEPNTAGPSGEDPSGEAGPGGPLGDGTTTADRGAGTSGGDDTGSGTPASPDVVRHMQATLFSLHSDVAMLATRLELTEERVQEILETFDLIEEALRQSAPAATPGWGDESQTAADPSPTAGDLDPSETSPGGGGPAGGESAEGDPAGGEPEVGLDLRRLVDWVRDNVALLLERKIPQNQGVLRWCRQWWLHPEAIARFEAVRRSWADAVVSDDGNAMVIYFAYLDNQMAVLNAEYGPFGHCMGGAHEPRSTVLGHDEPDEAYFLDFDQARAAIEELVAITGM